MFDPMMLQSGAKTGAMDMDTVEALSKALSAGYGTDVAQLSGGGALRRWGEMMLESMSSDIRIV